jgi:peptidoglycan/xylan/chitin deacetylase (PgdA/CDA1 family)
MPSVDSERGSPKRAVATVLTFDDGPAAARTDGRTRELAAVLAARDIAAAFFVQAGAKVVLELLGVGHVVGVHAGPPPEAPGLIDAKNRLTELAGRPPKYARAVGGYFAKAKTQAGLRDLLEPLDLMHVGWNLDSGDTFAPGASVRARLRQDAAKLVGDEASGIVVLFRGIQAITSGQLGLYIDDLLAGAGDAGGTLRLTRTKDEIDGVFVDLFGPHR